MCKLLSSKQPETITPPHHVAMPRRRLRWLQQLHRETTGAATLETIALAAIIAIFFIALLTVMQGRGRDVIAGRMDTNIDCQISLWRSGSNDDCGPGGLNPEQVRTQVVNEPAKPANQPVACKTTGEWIQQTELSDIDAEVTPHGWRVGNLEAGDHGPFVFQFKSKIKANVKGALMCTERCDNGTERQWQTSVNYPILSPEFMLEYQFNYYYLGHLSKWLRLLFMTRTAVKVATAIKESSEIIMFVVDIYKPVTSLVNRSADAICSGSFDQNQLQTIVNKLKEQFTETIIKKFSPTPDDCPPGHLCT